VSKPTAIVYDNVMDRKEVWHLLHRLHPQRRVEWLAWCCKTVTLPGSRLHPEPSLRRMGERLRMALRDDRADEVITNEIYFDVFQLAHSYSLDLDKATARLVEVVREDERAGRTRKAGRG
jgi:hypothetical protein